MNPFLPTLPLLAHVDNVADIAALTGWVVPLGIVGIVYYFAYHRNKMAHETLRKLIEKGQPITPEIIAALKLKGYSTEVKGNGKVGVSTRSRRDFRSGVILLGIGFGLVMLAGKAGWIVFFLGLAFFILSFMDRTEDSKPDIFEQVFHPKSADPMPAQQPPQPQSPTPPAQQSQPPAQPPASTGQPQ